MENYNPTYSRELEYHTSLTNLTRFLDKIEIQSQPNNLMKSKISTLFQTKLLNATLFLLNHIHQHTNNQKKVKKDGMATLTSFTKRSFKERITKHAPPIHLPLDLIQNSHPPNLNILPQQPGFKEK